MIHFDAYYFVAAEVESVEARDYTDRTHPYVLTVNMKSGKSYGLQYKDKSARDSRQRRLITEIDRELRAEAERIDNRLYRVEDSLRRLDKRQLKIWRQLRALLSLPAESEDE